MSTEPYDGRGMPTPDTVRERGDAPHQPPLRPPVRQQVVVLIVEHGWTHAEVVTTITDAVLALPGVTRVGGMITDHAGGTVLAEPGGPWHLVMPHERVPR